MYTKLKYLIRRIHAKVFPFNTISSLKRSHYLIFEQEHTYGELAIQDNWPNQIHKQFNEFKLRVEKSYIIQVNETCYKDPNYGWVILKKKDKIILESIPYSDYPFEWAKHPIPNKFDYHFKQYKKIHLKIAISCEMIHRFGTNYFHFFNSLLAQLALIESKGINLKVPILIPSDIFKQKFFQESILLFPKLQELDFIPLQQGVLYTFDAITFAKSNPYTIETFKLLHRFLKLPKPVSAPNINLFINRKQNQYRSIQNIEEISKIILSKGFVEYFPDDHNLKDQIETFRNCKNIVAIHGAGLTNLLFSYPNKINLFELFSNKQIVPGYYNMIFEDGGIYDTLLGSKENKNGKFTLPSNQFEIQFKKWLSQINH